MATLSSLLQKLNRRKAESGGRLGDGPRVPAANKPKPGFVYFVAFGSKGFIGRMVQFVTRSKRYSHIAYLPKRDDNVLVECWPWKFNRFMRWCWSDYVRHPRWTPYEVWELQVTEPQRTAIDDHMRWLANTRVKYDWLGVAGFVLRMVRDSKTRRFCSEGCVEPLVSALGWDRVTPSCVSPQNFVELIQAAGGRLLRKGHV